jgi:hypothetical protein
MLDEFSDMTDAWIEKVVKDNPCVLLPSGNIRTCPVRLSFVYLLGKSKPRQNDEGSYGANLLFPVCADLSLLEEEAKRVEHAKWPENDPKGPRYEPRKVTKVKSPFLDGADSLKYDGYHAGQTFLRCRTGANATGERAGTRKPVVVDAKQAPIVDPDLVYPGVWAVCTINPYAYAQPENKGVSFGLNTVMIVADDRRLAGGGPEDLTAAFGGLKIDSNIDASGLFD